MPRVPTRLEEFLTFVGTHANVFDVNHTALGIPAATATAFKSQVSNNQGLYTTQVNAQEVAKGAVGKQHEATRETRRMVADIIRAIDLTAANAADPASIYALAQVPAPASPSPAPPPGTPTDFKVGLNDDGAVLLSWKCPNPSGAAGTIYEVRRKPAGGTAYTYIGATGERKFTDDTLIAGSPAVTYQITAVRSTSRGAPASFNVSFGVGGPGGIQVTSVTEVNQANAGPTKLAA